MDQAIKKIVIAGGGTAGWLTAGILAAEHMSNSGSGIDITLIESPDVKTIGVGEGTWPTMRNTLETIGVSEVEFIQCCDVSFKQGSQFIGWVNGQKNDRYYHPFVPPVGYGECNLARYWQEQTSEKSFAHFTSYQAYLCDHNIAPKQFQTPEYAAVANYGYHLNAGKFAELLHKHCTEKLGVNYVRSHIEAINESQHGLIQSLTVSNSEEITGDLFIDCSGTHAILIGKHYQIPFINKKHILFNDSAIAVQVPYDEPDAPIRSQTVSTATDSGWIWDIALPTRKGIGHVFSSQYTNDETAKKTLIDYIAKDLAEEKIAELKFKKLTFEPGHREKFWHKNCVAVGMAAGFLEPLEASALALVELSAKMISKELPANQAILPITEKRFNERFHYRWKRIIEFLKLHYVLSERNSSQYWLDNKAKESIPEPLQELLTLWQYQPPSYNDLSDIEEIFPSSSYQYVLYGMGFQTKSSLTNKRFDDENKAHHYFKQAEQLTNKYLAGLPTNRELLNFINKNKNIA